MCWQCDHPDKTLEDYLATIREDVFTHGWVVQHVEDGRRPYAYTVGLHDRGLPELLVTGLAVQRAQWLLNTVARRVLAGLELRAGHRISLSGATRLEFVDVEHPDAHMDVALAIAGTRIRAVQLVWADARGRWPWAPGFDDGVRRQPVLGARTQKA